MKFSFFKKTILTITIASLILSGLGNVFTPKAAAQAGPSTPGAAVGQALAKGAACFLATKLQSFAAGFVSRTTAKAEDAANLVLNPLGVPVSIVAGGAAAVGASVETSNALIESKKCIRDVVVKMILDWVVDETVQWVQNGGTPRYVTNWDTFLSDAFNVGVGEIINESNLKFLCKPFGLQVKITLLPVPRFQNRISCTLDDIVANIDDFYNDFRNGSWIAYEESWLPQNNYYGALYLTMDEANIKGAQQKEAAQNEAMSGQGYLPVKKCMAYAVNANERLQRGEIKKLDDACTEWQIITPAPVVGSLTNRVAAADLDWAMSVQSWTVALTNAVVNRIIKEGVGLMKKSTAPKPAGYGDYDPYGGYDPTLSLKRQERDRIKSEYVDFLVYFNAILANKKSALSSEEQLAVILNDLKTRNCQPLVSDSDITTAQNEVTRLTNDVAYYQNVVNETQTNLNEAINISNDFRDREITLLSQHYNDFSNKYNSLITEISSGSETTKKASEDESKTKQTELSSNQSRLNLCIQTTH